MKILVHWHVVSSHIEKYFLIYDVTVCVIYHGLVFFLLRETRLHGS